MNTLSDKILNYAKDVNNHGNGVIYYRYRNKDPEQYEAAATFFHRLSAICITLYIRMVVHLLSIAQMNQ